MPSPAQRATSSQKQIAYTYKSPEGSRVVISRASRPFISNSMSKLWLGRITHLILNPLHRLRHAHPLDMSISKQSPQPLPAVKVWLLMGQNQPLGTIGDQRAGGEVYIV